MIKKLGVLVIFVAMILSSCGFESNNLIGEYSSKPDGKVEIKIFTKNGKTYGAILFNKRWDELELRPATDKESIRIVGKNWPTIGKSALINDKGFYLAQVEPGSSSGSIKFKTGFIVLIGFLPAELYKK